MTKRKKKPARKKALTPQEKYGPLNTSIRNYREASATRKFHAIAGHDYTVGQHAHAALQLLFALHPEPGVSLVKSTLALGMASRWIGDKTPQSGLLLNLAQMRAMAEKKILEELQQVYTLTDDEQEWLAGVDLTAVYLWCQDQMMVGNQNVRTLYRMVEDELKGRSKLPEQIKAFLSVSDWKRVGP